MEKPTIVVVNGTAAEGYWAVYYLLQTGRFRVRATVRRPDSALASRLSRLAISGNACEVVKAATDDESALRTAFAGAEGIYATSVYNIHARRYRAANPEERAQCHAVISAARSCTTLRHFVWQTMGRLEIPPEQIALESPIHFRTKWQFEEVIRDAGLPWIFLRQPAYMRQIRFGMQFRNRLVFPYPPDAKLAFVAEEDLGKLVAAIFSDPGAHLHQAINGVSEIMTPTEIARRAHRLIPAFSAKYRQASWLENAFFNHVIARLRPAFRYPVQVNANLRAGNYWAITARDLEHCRQLISPLQLTTFEHWMRENAGPGG